MSNAENGADFCGMRRIWWRAHGCIAWSKCIDYLQNKGGCDHLLSFFKSSGARHLPPMAASHFGSASRDSIKKAFKL
jgi:hypothetical protein